MTWVSISVSVRIRTRIRIPAIETQTDTHRVAAVGCQWQEGHRCPCRSKLLSAVLSATSKASAVLPPKSQLLPPLGPSMLLRELDLGAGGQMGCLRSSRWIKWS